MADPKNIPQFATLEEALAHSAKTGEASRTKYNLIEPMELTEGQRALLGGDEASDD